MSFAQFTYFFVFEGFTLNETFGTGQADQPQPATETQLRDVKSKAGVQKKCSLLQETCLFEEKKKKKKSLTLESSLFQSE